ncbi:MAG: FliA/WhiG family RNA polymerase sigma factor [Candidatus Poribacteria bacterium]|nr:FliA/WhiG family RNA polymerase sigma factor [Candidatus Poribacteria bacterium]
MEKLWRAYKFDSNLQAKEELVNQCLPLVKSTAYRMYMYASPSHDIDDLASAGIMGLLDAIDKFNPTKGAAFKTYAGYRIRGAILDEIRALDWVPRSVREKASELEAVYARLEQKMGYAPAQVDVAKEMGIPVDELHTMLTDVSCTSMLALEELCQDKNDEAAIRDTIADPNAVNVDEKLTYEETKDLLATAIDALPKQEKLVVTLYYHEELTMKEVGRVLDVSESRICQIHSSAILRLRAHIKKLREN